MISRQPSHGFGRGRPVVATGLPAWRQAAVVGTWLEIANTANGPSQIDAYSGVAWREDILELTGLACGGHQDSADNSVNSISLLADTPGSTGWFQRCAPSPAVAFGNHYNADGKPASRHTYNQPFWHPILGRYILAGSRNVYDAGGNDAHGYIDGFDPLTNTWDPQGTYAEITTTPVFQGYGQVMDGVNGEIWTHGQRVWNPTSNAVTYPSVGGSGMATEHTAAFDKSRRKIFTLQYGNGEGSDGPSVICNDFDCATRVGSAVTISASAAYSQWLAAAPAYAALVYDSLNDRWLFYHGYGAEAGVVYAISATGSTRTMTILATVGTPATVPASGAGLNKRFHYSESLKGCVLMPKQTANLWFLRTT